MDTLRSLFDGDFVSRMKTDLDAEDYLSTEGSGTATRPPGKGK